MAPRAKPWLVGALTIASLLGCSGVAISQTVISDLALDLTYDSAQPLLPGVTSTIAITVTNLGPSTSANPTVVSRAFPSLVFVAFPVPGTSPCRFVVDHLSGAPPAEIVALAYPPIAAGQSVTCMLGLTAGPRGSASYTWQLYAVDITPGNADPRSNGLRTVQLNFGSITAVHALSTPGKALLFLMLIGLAGMSARSTRRDPI